MAGHRAFRSEPWLAIPTARAAAGQAGVMELAALLPPNSHGEAAPADKDPVPLPFDSAFNVPEHDGFLQRVKYVRDDHFITQNVLDPPQLTKLNQAWTDLYSRSTITRTTSRCSLSTSSTISRVSAWRP